MNNYFCGWYFKCQSKGCSIAFIPAFHIYNGEKTYSLQFICGDRSYTVPIKDKNFCADKTRPSVSWERNRLDEKGIELNVDEGDFSAKGQLYFGEPSKISGNIMGPFKYVPFMECRHSVFSMRHSVNGKITVCGKEYMFEDGVGYIEGDRGYSFPKRYAWTQCLCENGSVMLSVADIPLGPISFTGLIGIVQAGDRQYRLATYLGARAVKIEKGEIEIKQGKLRLSVMFEDGGLHSLSAPKDGQMSRMIKENIRCDARYVFSENDRVILDVSSSEASLEYEY